MSASQLSTQVKLFKEVRCLNGPGEDENHRIYPFFLVALHERDNVNAERQECAVEEFVHQEHLTCVITDN